jgi:Cu/Ag efflux protein CusF
MKSILRSITPALVLVCLLASLSFAQQKKSYVFKGKVESVGERTMSVANDKIEGWMEAMTMSYSVDDPEVLKKIKAGDRITATVYDGDYVLHNVQVVPPTPPSKGK